jgi:hypothetical protein
VRTAHHIVGDVKTVLKRLLQILDTTPIDTTEAQAVAQRDPKR